jgi:ribosomal protein L1
MNDSHASRLSDTHQALGTRNQRPSFDRTKLYAPLEAITLAQAAATNKFDGKIEVHAVLTRTGKFGEYKTERKAPLLHAVLGKQSEKPDALFTSLEKLVKTVDARQIKKLVVCATMGPGVKVDLRRYTQ